MDFRKFFKLNYSNKARNNNNQTGNGTVPNTMTSSTAPLEPSNLYNEYFTAAEHATERVATLVNDNFDCNHLFCQMDMLRTYKNELVWKEMARWIRYEEAVEEGGQRWSKPHVASLMMEALQDLQNILSTCPVILDSSARTMADLAEEITNAWTKDRAIMSILKDKLISVLLKQHKFQHFKRSDMKKKVPSSANLQKIQQHEAYINKAYEKNTDTLQVPNNLPIPKTDPCPDSPSLAMGESNKSFMKKIPPGSEVVNLLVGEIPELDEIIAGFIRLKEACNIGDITEVDLNTKFVFIVLGPKLHLGHCAEMCRCMATLFTDEIFRCVAYRAEDRVDILCGVQEFSLHLTVLPPGVWNPSTRIEPPDELPSQDYRKSPGPLSSSKSAVSLVEMDKKSEESEQNEESHSDPTLVRTGRLFGGLLNDIRRKVPFYLSDFKDALHIQCVASFFFLFLATLTPNVTFGGLLGQATDQYMGTMECILAAAISGVLFALFAGQPLNILGSTGPMLVLESILYRFCTDQEWDFLPFRVWVGFWTGFFILLIVAFDLSALVRYITRFTEESFACLIALIFIVSAFKKTFGIEHEAPVHFNPPQTEQGCFCMLGNSTGNFSDETITSSTSSSVFNITATNLTTTIPTLTSTVSNISSTVSNISSVVSNMSTTIAPNVTSIMTTTEVFKPASALEGECLNLGGRMQGHCDDKYVPDVFFFSIILFFATFSLATALFHFRDSLFFPTFVRQNVSDFAVLISIIIMVCVDASLGLPTPKLMVPEEFKPTKPGRPWFINPISDKNPWWLMLLSAVPAVLATILIFMDQQITAVIVNRRENKLKKGSGYHLDMLVVGVLVVIHGLLGLPWYVAATVTALAHIMSLRKISECTAPGEKPTFLGVREQRVTAFLVGVFSGLAVLITSVLRYIPMPVLYGVFLYMGVAPLSGMQLCQRVLLVFMPAKYQPDYSYIRNVPIKRVHLFTLFQVICLAGLWVIKSIESISIAFPLMVLIICFVRKGLDKIFTQRELKWLDDILPATQVKKGESEIEKTEEPVLIKVTTEEGQWPEPPRDKVPVVRTLSAPEKESVAENGDLPSREALKPRMSLTFVCKTDIDRIKAMTPEVVTNRRQSLAMAVGRKRSIQTSDGGGMGYSADRRKFSSPLMIARKLSVESYASPFGNIPPTIEEHNKLNRMLSLPATIADENENENDSESETGSEHGKS
ncbi:electrogenic sodium bicarbonate cotransporter 1-like isoform X5 [Mercenaria mercenaria]|uniref:electrogenic sodium bicarbonate cotransporter 1-like isoform X5 n=1 Tax=Mercenaria mercenaria TaxID=6596 RepID=UPI00234E5959|nr:electrogenic sodium bicarbonate cotransporter 1-like isoform X5 [Mercenaria mercenaria]